MSVTDRPDLDLWHRRLAAQRAQSDTMEDRKGRRALPALAPLCRAGKTKQNQGPESPRPRRSKKYRICVVRAKYDLP
jgi:hypothetical protein